MNLHSAALTAVKLVHPLNASCPIVVHLLALAYVIDVHPSNALSSMKLALNIEHSDKFMQFLNDDLPNVLTFTPYPTRTIDVQFSNAPYSTLTFLYVLSNDIDDIEVQSLNEYSPTSLKDLAFIVLRFVHPSNACIPTCIRDAAENPDSFEQP